MRSAHTPGPWTLVPYPSNEQWRCFNVMAPDGIVEVGRVQLRRPIYGLVPDTSEAEARLMAAAPDLLAALSELVEAVRRDNGRSKVAERRTIKAVLAAQRALEAATGEVSP